MKPNSSPVTHHISLQSIFKYMMETGYYPEFEQTHIQFDLDGNIAVVDSEEGFVSLRLFFSIEQEEYDLFMEASNLTMLRTFAVKANMMEDMENIVFSCEVMCDNIRDLQRFFPRAIECMRDTVNAHKTEMRRLVRLRKSQQTTIPASDDIEAGITKKIFS